MNPVSETLFLPVTQGVLKPAGRAAFYNAALTPALGSFADIWLQQHFKPAAAALAAHGHEVTALPVSQAAGTVFLLLPKNITEARYFMALALQGLAPGGVLAAAAANDAGGARLKKIFEDFGFHDIQSLSKNHARVVWGVKKEIDEAVISEALAAGTMQDILNGAFQSQPGLFGWDKIDKGSEILAQHLPGTLKGAGADFGCGYGWLARHVLQHCEGVEKLSCIDADARAIEACKINLKDFSNTEFRWEDLSAGGKGQFDWIVMNPPFHEGKATDVAVGKGFIVRAVQNLKPGGDLWMVANAQLPYEEDLKKLFSGFEKKFEGSGFKIFKAVK